MQLGRVVFLITVSLFLAGCVSANSGNVYSRDETMRTQTVRMGVVESVRLVQIEGTKSPVGTIAGGAIGGIAGSSVGSGKTSSAVAVLGAVLGGLAGSAAEEGLTRKDGLEITVKLENGTMVAVVQEADEQFQPGDRVRLVESGDTTRVTH